MLYMDGFVLVCVICCDICVVCVLVLIIVLIVSVLECMCEVCCEVGIDYFLVKLVEVYELCVLLEVLLLLDLVCQQVDDVGSGVVVFGYCSYYEIGIMYCVVIGEQVWMCGLEWQVVFVIGEDVVIGLVFYFQFCQLCWYVW